MAQKNWQKIKLVKLLEFLRQESDEEHPLTTNQICDYMLSIDIPCDRRVVSRDIALLNEIGIEILQTWVDKSKAYYVEDRNFSVPELKILIDAVQAANFVTTKKTNEMVDKLANLGGTHRAEILKGNLVRFNTRKHSNEQIYYHVDAREDAIQRQKKVIFRYFDIDIDRKKAYRRDGHHYVVDPVALVYNEDNYYLISYSEKHDGTATYRVDRMDSVSVIDEDICEKALDVRGEVTEYTGQAFKMYGGRQEDVELRFDRGLIGAVYDRFGEDVNITIDDEDHCRAAVTVRLSPTFFSWLFQFGRQMKIVSPQSAITEYKMHILDSLM